MKQQLNTNLIIRSSLALALALTIWAPVQTQSAEPAEGKMMMGDKMMAACQKMKEQKQKMQADMMAQGAQLTEQITEMNRAPADQKLDLMAAILTRMEAQKLTMDARKAKMEVAMMQHMMQHMQMGKDSMAQCPMMKGMKGMEEKPADAQAEQK